MCLSILHWCLLTVSRIFSVSLSHWLLHGLHQQNVATPHWESEQKARIMRNLKKKCRIPISFSNFADNSKRSSYFIKVLNTGDSGESDQPVPRYEWKTLIPNDGRIHIHVVDTTKHRYERFVFPCQKHDLKKLRYRWTNGQTDPSIELHRPI